jgi:hypothetical protein
LHGLFSAFLGQIEHPRWWVVDTLDDVPPWYLDGVLRDDWHGFRLELPAACREFLSLASPLR